jgi:predicted short-subunit dehydrogenase-like oxidoreductase (DUF2520 family)
MTDDAVHLLSDLRSRLSAVEDQLEELVTLVSLVSGAMDAISRRDGGRR